MIPRKRKQCQAQERTATYAEALDALENYLLNAQSDWTHIRYGSPTPEEDNGQYMRANLADLKLHLTTALDIAQILDAITDPTTSREILLSKPATLATPEKEI